MWFLLCFSLFGDVNSKRNKLYILEEDYNNNLPPGKFITKCSYTLYCTLMNSSVLYEDFRFYFLLQTHNLVDPVVIKHTQPWSYALLLHE